MTLKMEETQTTKDGEQTKDETSDAGLCVGGLDNTAYLPSTMASPALMVFASTDVTQGGLHVQRPFSGQGLDKDLHSPYTNSSSYPVRPIFSQSEGYPPLQSHVYPQLVNTNLDRQMGFLNPSSTGAFRPMNTEDQSVNGFRGSAFIPAKCLKLEPTPPNDSVSSAGQQHLTTRYHNDGNFHNLPNLRNSPVGIKEECNTDKDSNTTSPEVGERLTDTPVIDSDTTERTTPEEGRILRKIKKRGPFDGKSPCCPICGLTIRQPELAAHFEHELDKLGKINKTKRPSRESTPQSRSTPSIPGNKKKELGNDKGTPEVRWETYQRVKSNRQNRLNASSSPICAARKGKKKRPMEETCSVCNERLSGTSEEINNHIESCLRKKETESDEENVDVEDEFYEEYEWAGQTRIRATSLLHGRFSASGYQVGKHDDDDDDQDLNVDGDDTVTYGQAQYTEADVIPCTSDEPLENKERQELRKALLMNETPNQQRLLQSSKWNMENDDGIDEKEVSADNHVDSENDDTSEQVITSLKEKIKELEEQQKVGEKMKCLICMDSYTKPAVSVCCWHVHCEECWLRTLGTKKLCPQCNAITSPGDLRRIYL
ncbi:E3 ubiquitin-protein ligase RNF220-like isoform X2 [Centruroides sculpturatus]|uniref:E3 ubiquitin-protein ligase RNF220-like isoform X2 n=1 Tax=Centruroides sculpturatus TaxID=218467 RepID=UPI000C6C9385|nr:E3 ubiquitin-protein ligase RNF220-like isoform X2 [Centruroides sculpturatus]